MEWKGVGVRGCTGKYNFADFFIITIIFFYWIFPPLGPGHFAETMPSPRAAFMVCLCCCGCGCLSFGPNKMKSHNNSAGNYRKKFEYSLNNILFHLFLLLLRTSTILFCSAPFRHPPSHPLASRICIPHMPLQTISRLRTPPTQPTSAESIRMSHSDTKNHSATSFRV